jgi:CubicO group peptidase (beta-lactamase class C family)
VRYFFKHAPFLNEPGTTFLYNNANAYILGCLIEKKSGQNLREYLR